MRVAVLYECSGTVRDAFIAAGHEAVSVDLLPTMRPGPHFQMDVWAFLALYPDWDLVIAHPECTYVTVSGLHRNKNNPERAAKTEAAVENFRKLLRLPMRVIAENPVSCLSTRIKKPIQIVQPYDFGHDASKKTCFWTNDEEAYENLVPTFRWPPRLVAGRERDGEIRPTADRTDSALARTAGFSGASPTPASRRLWRSIGAAGPCVRPCAISNIKSRRC